MTDLNDVSVLVVIPARGGSKRIPNKNIRFFLGKEIISYPIGSALSCKYVSRVIVSTDSENIKKVSERHGADVPFMRSEVNASDHATTFDVIEEVCSKLPNIDKYDFICCLYPTSVFVDEKLLCLSIEKTIATGCSGVVSVLEYSHPIQRALNINEDGMLGIVNPDYYNCRSQDLPKMYHDAGQLYLFKLEDVLNERKLITKNMIPIVLYPATAQDIDNESDWELAEIKYMHYRNEKK